LLIAVGVSSAVTMYVHPEALRVPAWVAYAAVSSFPLCGAALLALAFGSKRLVTLLGICVVVGLLVPFLWITFGPGPMDCSVSVIGVAGEASDWLCRAGFGLASLLGLVVLGLIIRAAVKQARAA
jgi:hypothetical protein